MSFQSESVCEPAASSRGMLSIVTICSWLVSIARFLGWGVVTYATMFRSRPLLQRRGVDRQLSQALASCRKDRVGYCRSDGRSPGLTHSARRLGVLDDVDFDRRRLIDAQDLVGIEVGLLDTAILETDLAIERRREPEHDRALDLRPDGIWIDDSAAIDCADNASDTNLSIPRHLDLSDLRHIGSEDELEGDAAADSLRQRLSPAGFFRDKLEDCLGAG